MASPAAPQNPPCNADGSTSGKFLPRVPNLLILLLLLGMALRLAAARGDLWLDEIMSLNSVQGAGGLIDILSLYHDNNHVLTSLWLWLVSSFESPIILRALSLTSGLASGLLLMTWPQAPGMSSQAAEIQRLLLMGMWAVSYPLVLYESEARGYAQMVAGGLACTWILLSGLKGKLSHLLFLIAGLYCVLGHSSGLLWIAALLGGSLLVPEGGSMRSVMFRWSPMLLFSGIWWLSFISHLPPGSGAHRPWYEVYANLLSVSVGGPTIDASVPERALLGFGIAALVLIAFFKISWFERHYDRQIGIICLLGGVLLPILTVLLLEPRVVYERYFLCTAVLFYLLMGRFGARMWEGNRAAVVGGAALFLIVHLSYVHHLISVGRGSYQELLRTVIAQSEPGPIQLWGDHSFRIPTVVGYHKHALSGGMRLEFVAESQDAGAPDWLLLHSQAVTWDPPAVVNQGAWTAERVTCEQSALLSGFNLCAFKVVRGRSVNITRE